MIPEAFFLVAILTFLYSRVSDAEELLQADTKI